MGTLSNFQHFILPLSILVAVVTLAWVTIVLVRRRGGGHRKSQDLVRFSNLHLFSKELADCADPQEMNGRALRGALGMLEIAEGYLLLTPNGPGGTPCAGARGLSPAAVQRLDSDDLRSYLATCGERWGTLMVFPDLRRAEILAAWQRDPVFQEFRDVLTQEGLRTVIVSGLLAHGKSYGALLLGSRKLRNFPPQSLRMILALSNQISVAMENWSLNRAADSGIDLAKHGNGNQVRVASLALESCQAEWEQQLLEAYLGVTVKRLFSTGPETFNRYLHSFERQAWKADGEGPSLLETVTALAFAIDAKDHYTQGHSQSVARLAAEIARELGLGNAEVEEIRLAGILHDIGKIGVPEIVLNKPTRLTMEEFDLVKSHAVLGEKILKPLKVKAIERIRRMIRHHHERFDGLGYPDQLKGEAIPLGARILTVADCFDTMISQRAYKRGRTTQEAVAELRRCCGTQFDPVPVDALIRVLALEEEPQRRAASLLEKAAEC